MYQDVQKAAIKKKAVRPIGMASRTFFSILRPDLARSEAEKKHREQLTNFILSMRDASKNDRIKIMLHKKM